MNGASGPKTGSPYVDSSTLCQRPLFMQTAKCCPLYCSLLMYAWITTPVSFSGWSAGMTSTLLLGRPTATSSNVRGLSLLGPAWLMLAVLR